MRPVEKALALRLASSMKSSEPMRAFSNHLLYPKKILSLVEKSAEGDGAKNEARRQYVVCLAAAFETFWGAFFKTLIDSHHFLPAKLSHLSRLTFTFPDVFQIVGKKLSLGELITCAYTFQSPAAVNQCASELLGIDAFAELKKAEFKLQPGSRENRSGELPAPIGVSLPGEMVLRQLPLIEECFSVRHETVHHSGKRLKIPAPKLERFEGAIVMFNLVVSLFIRSKVEPIHGAKKDNKPIQPTS